MHGYLCFLKIQPHLKLLFLKDVVYSPKTIGRRLTFWVENHYCRKIKKKDDYNAGLKNFECHISLSIKG